MKIVLCALAALSPIASLAEDSPKPPAGTELPKTVEEATTSLMPAKDLIEHLQAFAKTPGRKAKDGDPSLSDLLDQIAGDERILENTIYLTKALPILRPMLDAQLGDPKLSDEAPDEHVQILSVLVSYAVDEDLARLETALKQSFAPKSYEWGGIFDQFHSGNENAPKLAAAFKKHFPSEPIARQALRAFNALLVDGNLKSHPFDCPAGIEQLRKWLVSDGDEPFNATVACAFLPELTRKELLALAKKHKDVAVQMEAAWASAKAGDATGIDDLVAFAKTLKTSRRACEYLDELNRKEVIPKEAMDPDFAARAETSDWFSHPAEVGRHPDEVTIVDSRELNWPPTEDKRRLWIIKAVFKPEAAGEKESVHMALTGSSTFSLFERTSAAMTPEQILLIHCHWEMETESDDSEIPIQKALDALQKANPGMFDNVKIPTLPKPEKDEADATPVKKAEEKAK